MSCTTKCTQNDTSVLLKEVDFVEKNTLPASDRTQNQYRYLLYRVSLCCFGTVNIKIGALASHTFSSANV